MIIQEFGDTNGNINDSQNHAPTPNQEFLRHLHPIRTPQGTTQRIRRHRIHKQPIPHPTQLRNRLRHPLLTRKRRSHHRQLDPTPKNVHAHAQRRKHAEGDSQHKRQHRNRTGKPAQTTKEKLTLLSNLVRN